MLFRIFTDGHVPLRRGNTRHIVYSRGRLHLGLDERTTMESGYSLSLRQPCILRGMTEPSTPPNVEEFPKVAVRGKKILPPNVGIRAYFRHSRHLVMWNSLYLNGKIQGV